MSFDTVNIVKEKILRSGKKEHIYARYKFYTKGPLHTQQTSEVQELPECHHMNVHFAKTC
jgi:hypothetical protein